MGLTKNKFYFLLSVSCLAGYAWLAYSGMSVSSSFNPCIFRHVTGIPCPSCGSTRSVLSLINGNILGAIQWNPLGIVLAGILTVSPFWIIYDLIMLKSGLYNTFLKAENFFRNKMVALPSIALILFIWIWNIYKDVH